MINSIKTPSFFRPSTRPSSPLLPPAQDTMGPDRVARPHSKLSLSNFRRASPSPASGLAPLTVTQDGSYMEVLSLKLSEAVSKALAQPVGNAAPHELLAGRRPIPAGRGRSLGALIVSEIQASRENPHLHRAIIRTLHRPLSVLLSNLSGNLLPLLSSPAFQNPATNIHHIVTPNATQLHAIGLATLAGELLETFDELGLGLETDMRGDGLKTIREGLISVVKRVMDPVISGMKTDVMPVIEALENPHVTSTPNGHGGGLKPTGSSKSTVAHPSIVMLQATMPGYARVLSRYATSATAENTLASLLISFTWRGLVALSNRPVPPPTPPGSPVLSPSAQKGKDLKRRGSSITPPITPPSSRFTLKLPPSRPPSPGTPVIRSASAVSDARALRDLLATLPRPSSDKPATHLAGEAVDEAFASLHALASLLDAAQPPAPAPPARGRAGAPPAEFDLDALTSDLPMLIALPVLLRACSFERGVAQLLGLSEAEYRAGCLGGFGRAEECALAVGQRVLHVLRAQVPAETGAARFGVVGWLDRQVKAVVDH